MYQQNKFVKGQFVLGGRAAKLENIDVPALTIYAKEDHIVPPATTKPIHEKISSTDKELMEFPGGHIGVFVGARAQSVLAPAIATWLKERDAQ
jgi:polyhydroxyalkanoate synthase